MTQEFIAAQGGRLITAYLPPYAPELNPVEYIWGYWKHHELPDFCPDDLSELGFFGRRALRRMQRVLHGSAPSGNKPACHYNMQVSN